MNMTMAPADDASAKALGPAADQLSQVAIKGTGQGAIQVIDPLAGKSNMSMDLEMNAVGQKIMLHMIMVGDTAWVRMGDQGDWQKSDAKAGASKSLGGMDPKTMLESYRNATKVQFVEDTKLGEEAVRHLHFVVDPSKTDMSSVVNSATANSSGQLSPEDLQAIMKEMTIDVDVWLTAKELQLRQEKMVMSFTMPLPGLPAGVEARLLTKMDLLMRFDKINQPVKIEPPAGS